jgi:hypothetical protein
MVFKINKSAANNDNAITALSVEKFFIIGVLRMKVSDEGIGTNETILKPIEVTAATKSNPIKSNIERKN